MSVDTEAAFLLEVENITKTFVHPAGFWKRLRVEAIKPTSFYLEKGKTLAILGDAGSGKSTLARILAGAVERSGGDIRIQGESLAFGDYQRRCRLIRMIFQNPAASLPNNYQVGQLLTQVLSLNEHLTAAERHKKIVDTLVLVGLDPDCLDFYPALLSEGQKHRLALARALILDPPVVITDEAWTRLDSSVRAQLINVLLTRQAETGLSYIMVANDLALVSHISDDVLVMHEGAVVEWGKTLKVFTNPQHDITKRLLQNYNNEYRRRKVT